MPPRKSIDSAKSVKTPNGVEDSNATPSQTPKETQGLSVEDLILPRSMIQRLAKGVLPANTQIQKDALLAMCKSATVFVNYLAAQAHESSIAGGKRTIQPKDVLYALEELEFDQFLPRCETELLKYNTVQCDKRNAYRRKIRDGKRASEGGPNDTTMSTDTGSFPKSATLEHNNHEGEDEPPVAKKPRTSLDPTINGENSHINETNGLDDTVDEDEGDAQMEEEEDEDVEEEEVEELDEDVEDDEFHSAESGPEDIDGRIEEDKLENDGRRGELGDEEDEEGSESD